MAALAPTSFEIAEDNASDISEEIDELAGDLDPITEVNATEDDDDSDNIYEIEKIVDHRTYRGSIQYMIKWKGYPDKHNSWVSKEDVYAEQKTSEYWNRKEIEAKEKIKLLVDKHNDNTNKSLKRQRSSTIKKNKDKYNNKKGSFKTKTKGKVLNNDGNSKNKERGGYQNGIGGIDVNRNSGMNNNGNKSLGNYYTNPLQPSEIGEANNDGHYENEEMLKYDEDEDEYDNFTPAAIAGSWEPFVKDVATIQQDPCTGTLIVFLNWKNGHRTSHSNKVTNVKCPQKMLEFYQQHVQFVPTNH